MNDKLLQYINGVFTPYSDIQQARELKEELITDLQQKYSDFKEQGCDDEAAYLKTIDSIGEIEEILDRIAGRAEEPGQSKKTGKKSFADRITDKAKELLQLEKRDLSCSSLRDSDLKGIRVDGKFNSSDLRSSDFSGSDLTGSSFKYADLRDVKFDGANLTGAKFIAADLRNVSFQSCVLDSTDFRYSGLGGACFDSLTLNGTIFSYAALSGTIFKNTVFRNIRIKYSDFSKAVFEEVTMDKLTYVVLKGGKANLDHVIVI